MSQMTKFPGHDEIIRRLTVFDPEPWFQRAYEVFEKNVVRETELDGILGCVLALLVAMYPTKEINDPWYDRGTEVIKILVDDETLREEAEARYHEILNYLRS